MANVWGDPSSKYPLGPTSSSVRVRNTFFEVVADESGSSGEEDKQESSQRDSPRRGGKIVSPTNRRNTSAPPSPSRRSQLKKALSSPADPHPCTGSPAELSNSDELGSSETAPPTSSVSSRHGSLGSYEAWQETMMQPRHSANSVSQVSGGADAASHDGSGNFNCQSPDKYEESVGSNEAWPQMVGHGGSAGFAFGMPGAQDFMMSSEHLDAMGGYYANAGYTAAPLCDNYGMTLSTSPLSTAPPSSTGIPMPWLGGYQMTAFDAARCTTSTSSGADFGLDSVEQPYPGQSNATGERGGFNWQGRPGTGANSTKRNPRTMNRPLVPPSGRQTRNAAPDKELANPQNTFPWLTPPSDNHPSAVQQLRMASGKSKNLLLARDYGGGGGPKRMDYSKKSNVGSDATATSTPITTMMLRHIPCRKTQEEVMQHIDHKGFKGQYDFLYLPSDTRCGANLGYAFVNFVAPEPAARFKLEMNGYRFSGCGSAKACAVATAHVQGLAGNLATFKNMEVMRSARKPFFLASDQR